MQAKVSVQLTSDNYSHVCVTLSPQEYGSAVHVRYQRNRLSEHQFTEAWQVECERAQYVRELDFGAAMSHPYAAEVCIPCADSWRTMAQAEPALRLLRKAETLAFHHLMDALKRAKVQVQWVYHRHGRDVDVAELSDAAVGNARRFVDGLHCTQLVADDMLKRARERAAA